MRGLHVAATGMVAQQLRQEVISNNLANAITAGYKVETATVSSFPEMLLARLEGRERQSPIGRFSPGIMVDGVRTDFSQGPLEETGRSTDLALVDRPGSTPSFFVVQVGEEIRYTRGGEFKVDSSGFLVTAQGYPLLGYGGPITVGQGRWRIDGTGAVWVDDVEVDRLALATFEEPQRLRRAENNLFAAPPDLPVQEAQGAEVKQGFLERPNLDSVREIINMLAVVRAYEAGQKVIQVQDEILGKSVNEIGSLR